MDKPEDLLLLDVIEVDDEESYSDLIGGEDGLEMEDNTESEYFEEDSEVTEESQEGVGESLDVYVDDTQDDLDADIKDREKSVNSNTEEVQSSDKAENASQRSSSTSSTSVKRLNDDRKTSVKLKSSIVSVERLKSSTGKKPGSNSGQRSSSSGQKISSDVEHKPEKPSTSGLKPSSKNLPKSNSSSNKVQKSSSSSKDGQKTESSSMQKARSSGQKPCSSSGQKSSDGSVQKSSGGSGSRSSNGNGQKSGGGSGGNGQKSSSGSRHKSSGGSGQRTSSGSGQKSNSRQRQRSGHSEEREEKVDSKVSMKSSASEDNTGAVPVPSCNLWVSGINSSTRANDLKALFNKHVKVVAAKIMTNARSPDSSCFGYIILSSIEDAKKCIASLNNTKLNGNTISLTFDKPKVELPKSQLSNSSETAVEKPKEAVKKTVSKTSSNTIKVNKTQGRTSTKTKVTDVKGQTQKPENCQTDKKSGDMRPRPTQKTRDNKRDKPAAAGKPDLEKKEVKGSKIISLRSKTNEKGSKIISPKSKTNDRGSKIISLKSKSNEKGSKIISLKSKSNEKGSKIISLKSKSTDKAGEGRISSRDRSVSSKDQGDKPRRVIHLNWKPGGGEGRGWQSSSGWMRNHRIGYFKSRSAMSHSYDQQRNRLSPFRTTQVVDKSRRLKDLHIKQRAEAYKLEQERDEIRKATEEMEWRKQQEQIRLEQLDLERREREWEEQQLLEQIREEEERLRFEEEQRIVVFEEEQRRLVAEEMRIREEERMRFIEPVYNEQDRFVDNRWSPQDGDRFREPGNSPDDRPRGQHRDEGRGYQAHHEDRKHRDRHSAERYEARKKEEREREKQRKERERQERERRDREKREKERQEQLERERQERERKEQERRERERLDQERRERERLEREMKEQERRDREKLEKERQERLRLEKEKEAQEKEKLELAERVKQLERENEEIRIKENKIKEELRLEKEEHDRIRRESLKRSYEPRGHREDYPAQVKRQNMSENRYSSQSDRGYDNYQSTDHPRRNFNRTDDQREVYLEHREIAYSKDQTDYDERERYNKFAGERTVTVYRKFDNDQYDRISNSSAPSGYERSKSDYRRDHDRYHDSLNNHNRNREVQNPHTSKTNSNYNRPRNDNKGETRGTSYTKGHGSGNSHGYGREMESSSNHGYSKGIDQGRSHDRNKGRAKKDYVEYKSSSKRDSYKSPEVSNKSKLTTERKDVSKGRSTDDLWRNAGYGKTTPSNRDQGGYSGSSGDRGPVEGNYPGSNTQSTWSQRGRNSSSNVRAGGDYQPNQPALSMKTDSKGPGAWGNGTGYSVQGASMPQTRMSTSFGSGNERLNPGNVQDMPVQQSVMFQDGRLSNPSVSMPYPMMSVPQRNSGPSMMPHPNPNIIPQPQPSVGMVPHPQEQGVQPGFVNVTYKYYTPGRPF